jgi:four helix bundle protein
MSNYENLKVWHRAVDLAVSIYKLTTSNKSFVKDFGLKDQIQRSSVSIPSNISEGDNSLLLKGRQLNYIPRLLFPIKSDT